MKNKIAIFGADGFIGRHLVKELSHGEKTEIIAFDKFSGYSTKGDHPFDKLDNVTIFPGNFFNRESVGEALDSVDTVVHLISTTTPASADKDPLIDIQTNILGSVELFNLCVEKNVKRVIFPSSGGTVYGDTDSTSISETGLPKPRSPYGIGKLSIEHYLRYFKHVHGLDYVVLRIANPYGPGQNIYGKQGVIPIFMHKILNNKPITIYGDGSMERDYLYIEDLIKMIKTVINKKTANHALYNIGSGRGVSINDLCRSLNRCTENEIEKEYLDTPSSYIRSSVLDIDRYVEEFGFSPAIDLDEGIRRTWEYVKHLDGS